MKIQEILEDNVIRGRFNKPEEPSPSDDMESTFSKIGSNEQSIGASKEQGVSVRRVRSILMTIPLEINGIPVEKHQDKDSECRNFDAICIHVFVGNGNITVELITPWVDSEQHTHELNHNITKSLGDLLKNKLGRQTKNINIVPSQEDFNQLSSIRIS